jgi:inosine-uridine nucleoside N-ribohydrolase
VAANADGRPNPGVAELAGRKPVRLILDSDMDSDCDDAGALAVLHALADRGEVDILGVMISALDPHAGQCADAINTYYGRPDLPIGVARPPAPNQKSKYTRTVADRCKHDLPPGDKAPDAVELYRQILSAQPDQSVTVVTVGDMTNLAKLVRSGAKNNLPDGITLVRAKVKLWVCMGGNFIGKPARDDLKLGNNNFTLDPTATYEAIRHWPTPIVFVGREVCSVPSGLKAGARLKETPADNPVRIAYESYFGGQAQDRHVADQATVLYAVRGLRDDWYAEGAGRMDLRQDMTFTWNYQTDRRQAYLLKKMEDGKSNDRRIERMIEDLMTQPPRKGNPDQSDKPPP